MKKTKLLTLCALFVAGTVCLVACGNNRNNGTEAPYEDETNKNVNGTNNTTNGTDNNLYNDTTNGVNGTEGTLNNDMDVNPGTTHNNGTIEGDVNGVGNDLKDAGNNLIDSVKDTGEAIKDGVEDLTGTNHNNTNNNTRTNP